MPLKERTLNIPVPPKISFSQKDPVSPLLLSPERRLSGQHLAQTWKSPSQESDSSDATTVDPYADAIAVSTLLREPEWDKFEEERERKKRLKFEEARGRKKRLSKDRKVWSSTKKKRLTTRNERQAIQFAVKKEMIISHGRQELQKKKQRKEDEQRRLEQRREDVHLHTLQVDQGVEVASANRPLKPAAFPKEAEYDTNKEEGRKTFESTPSPSSSPYKRKESPTPESRLSSGSATFGSFFSEATRQPENCPRALFPYGSPCLGCRDRICPNMRIITTVKNMAIKHFESMIDKEFYYNSTQERRNAIYKIYKKHVRTLRPYKEHTSLFMHHGDGLVPIFTKQQKFETDERWFVSKLHYV